MKTENYRCDTFIGGIISKQFRMGAHEMADRRRMATKFIAGAARVRIALFHQERSAGSAHITDGSAARGFPARRAAQMFLKIGNAELGGKGRIVEEHTIKKCSWNSAVILVF
jgi:hypothetical protein